MNGLAFICMSGVKAGLLTALLATGLAVPAAQAQTAPSRTYTPGAFDEVEIHGSAEVRLAQGTVDQVVVEGDEEFQSQVRLDVRNGRLNVQQSGAWKFWATRRLQLTVTLRDLKRLSISGAADVLAAQPMKLGKLLIDISGAGLARFDRLQAQELRFSVSGAGDGQFAGHVDQLSVAVSGKSDFRGEQLRAQTARITVSGLGEIKVWAEEELAITVSGVGKVDYWGSPEVKRRTSGLATVNARGAKAVPP
jgi:hypothetical protein